MEHVRFHYPDLAALRAELDRLGVTLPLSEDLSVLKKPAQVGRFMLANRLAVQPMEGCDGTAQGEPDELTSGATTASRIPARRSSGARPAPSCARDAPIPGSFGSTRAVWTPSSA